MTKGKFFIKKISIKYLQTEKANLRDKHKLLGFYSSFPK